MTEIVLTVGVYNDNSYVTNGVDSSDLKSHIQYNLNNRPGRAFFVDGKCHNEGYLGKQRCDEWEKWIADNLQTPATCTAPYI
ncbi:hypothetical protein AB6T85_19950 [Erwinia sp. ACCC 02193]|uniref:Uncharacterized protein n=1 Tax=Erwinia aeris TaxID=3239803 RepID=A0ABV4ECU5_9GAMM